MEMLQRPSEQGGGEFLLPITSSTVASVFQRNDERLESHIRFSLDSSGRIVRRTSTGEIHCIAPSFTAFLATHVERLLAGQYEVKPVVCDLSDALPAGGISRFAFPDPCGSDCVTAGIRVQTGVLWVPEESATHRQQFTYRIRITHTGETAIDATLTTRRWMITDGHGNEEVVVGDGVIGLHPVSP